MKGKLLLVAGAAAGYVLGARAGRERYEQIRDAAATVWDKPIVQKRVNVVQDAVSEQTAKLPGLVLTGLKRLLFALLGIKDSRASTPIDAEPVPDSRSQSK